MTTTTKKGTTKEGSKRPVDIWQVEYPGTLTTSWFDLTPEQQQKYLPKQQRKRTQQKDQTYTIQTYLQKQQRKRKQPEKDQTNAWVGGMLVTVGTVGVTLALIFGLRHK